MDESFGIFIVASFLLIIGGIYLINDKVKILKYRLEQQIEQNERIIQLLTNKIRPDMGGANLMDHDHTDTPENANIRKTVTVRNVQIGGKNLLVCVPIVAGSPDEIVVQCREAVGQTKKPDLIEWRADFFRDLTDTGKVLDVAAAIRREIGEIPLIFTIRSQQEGGQPILLTEQLKLTLLGKVMQSNLADIIDYELRNSAEDIRQLKEAAARYGVKLILSHHNFQATPSSATLVEILREAERLGADIGKVAVMPQAEEDVLHLLQATLQASQTLEIPVITISMGALGAVTRLTGWMFGSSVTFAAGVQSSAPGQVPVQDVHTVISILQKFQN